MFVFQKEIKKKEKRLKCGDRQVFIPEVRMMSFHLEFIDTKLPFGWENFQLCEYGFN